MKVGIVGSEGAKFTPETEWKARLLIVDLLSRPEVNTVVSGGCHLGGIDIWAEEIGDSLRIKKEIFLPKNLQWSTGYGPRNRLIAQASDELHCITLKELPPEFKGMRFPFCYHCGTNEHVKSGGCWTMKYAAKLGKKTFLHVLEA